MCFSADLPRPPLVGRRARRSSCYTAGRGEASLRYVIPCDRSQNSPRRKASLSRSPFRNPRQMLSRGSFHVMTAPRANAGFVLATWFGTGIDSRRSPAPRGASQPFRCAGRSVLFGHVLCSRSPPSDRDRGGRVVGRQSWPTLTGKTKDPQIVVIDEVAGMLVTVAGGASHEWRSQLAGLLLFRVCRSAQAVSRADGRAPASLADGGS